MQEDTKKENETEQVENYLALAREFQDQHLYQKTEDTLLLGLEKIPNHPFLLTRLANFYFKTDRVEQALKTLDRLIISDSDFSFSYYLRGKIFEDQKNYDKAISNYKKALTRTTKDSHILAKLIPLLIANKCAEEALKLIAEYKDLFKDPFLFSEMEAEALVGLEKKVEAFNKMRSILMKEPENKNLLKKYLKLSILTGKKSPLELYDILSKTVPQLGILTDEELMDLEVDFLIHHEKYQEAEEKIGQMIRQLPERFHWRRKNVLLKKQIGNIEAINEELEILFLYNPADTSLREIFDDHFIETNQLERWKKVIQKAKRISSHNGKFSLHLRDLSIRHNLLSKSLVDHNSFIASLDNFNFENSELTNITYQKLPLYALETFITQIGIEDKIPVPEELWDILYKERVSEDKEVPFQIEDLNLAYPVWLFSLQFYFLFRSFSNCNCYFKPYLFQQDYIALTAEIDEIRIQVDIQQLLIEGSRNPKTLEKVEDEWRWRWPSSVEPERKIKGIPTFSKSQLFEALDQLKAEIAQI